ncbi:MAG: ROK family protein [Candidatus Omnitrophica bacterium]|nr:ROK family protein [Candidatus Omnitrophota bacterium]
MAGQYSIGIDLGGTNVKFALLKDSKKVVDKRVLATKNYKTREGLISQLALTVSDILKTNKIKKSGFIGLGIGVAGLVDFNRGFIHSLTNIKGWDKVSLGKILSDKLKVEVSVDNDVNVVTLGEHKYGAGRGFDNLICLTLGTGVGAGLILNGSLYRGPSFTAGEVGHIPINVRGPKCNCGGRGCLERYVGNRYIIRMAKKLATGNRQSKMYKLVEGKLNMLTPKIVSEAAILKDKAAILVWQKTGQYIGVALSGLINLLNPEVIIIGGGVSLAGKPLFDSIRKTVFERAMPNPASKVKIVPAKLGEDAGVIGASILAASKKNK